MEKEKTVWILDSNSQFLAGKLAGLGSNSVVECLLACRRSWAPCPAKQDKHLGNSSPICCFYFAVFVFVFKWIHSNSLCRVKSFPGQPRGFWLFKIYTVYNVPIIGHWLNTRYRWKANIVRKEHNSANFFQNNFYQISKLKATDQKDYGWVYPHTQKLIRKVYNEDYLHLEFLFMRIKLLIISISFSKEYLLKESWDFHIWKQI